MALKEDTLFRNDDKLTGDGVLKNHDLVMNDAAIKESSPSAKPPGKQPAPQPDLPPDLKEGWNITKGVLQNRISSYSDLEKHLCRLLLNTSITTEERFGTIAAFYRHVVVENSISSPADSAGPMSTFGQVLFRCLTQTTDIAHEAEGSHDNMAVRFGKLYNAVYSAATMPDNVFIYKAIPFILQGDITQTGTGKTIINKLWFPDHETYLDYLPESLADYFNSWKEWLVPGETAKPAVSWPLYIEHVGKTLYTPAGGRPDKIAELYALINAAAKSAKDDKSAKPLHDLLDKVIDNIQAYADGFGPGFGKYTEIKLKELKYKVYFFKGLLSGLLEACIAKENWSLLFSAAQLVIVGCVLSPATGTAFIAGTLYQIGMDIYSMLDTIYRIVTNLDAIRDKVISILEGMKSVVNTFLQLDYGAMLEKLPDAMKAAGDALKSFNQGGGEQTLLDMIEGFGHFIGAGVVTGTINFFLEDARGFDLLTNTLWNNAGIAWNYFFNWGAFIGPLILEIIISLTTGVGTIELIGKNGAKLLARVAPRLYEAIKLVFTKVLQFIVRIAGELKDLFVDNIYKIFKLVNDKLDIPAEKIKAAFEWLCEFCEPADLAEFVFGLIDALFLPSDEKAAESGSSPQSAE